MAFKLYVGRLPSDISEQDLKTVFSTYGEVERIELLVPDPVTGLANAHAYYTKSESAEDAIQVLNDVYKIRADAQHPILVQWAKEDVPMTGAEWNKAEDTQWAPTAECGGCKPEDPVAWGGSGAASMSSAPPPPQYTQVPDNGSFGNSPRVEEDGTHKLFVGGLPGDITEEELKIVFNTYGEVKNVVTMKPMQSTGLRAAFVFYAKRESGEDAIKVLNDQYKIRDNAQRAIQVRWAKTDLQTPQQPGQPQQQQPMEDKGFKVFVGNLPPDISEEEMNVVFRTYGEVKLIHILNSNNANGNRAALVFYLKPEAAEDAIKALNGIYKIREDQEQPIQVKWGRDKTDQPAGKGGWGGAGGGKDQGGWNNSWNAGGTSDWNSGGKGWQAPAAGNAWQDNSGGWQGKGSGGWQSGGWQDKSGGGWSGGWQDGGNNWNSGGSNWQGSSGAGGWQDSGSWGGGGKGGWKGDGKDGGKGKGKEGGKDGGKGGGKPEEPSNKLYVANLPEDIQSAAVEFVFGNYGAVQKVHLMNTAPKNGAIAAFVEYGTQDEADTAINSLNQKYEIREGYGPILVSYARKQYRPY